jgi:hypothetical protein
VLNRKVQLALGSTTLVLLTVGAIAYHRGVMKKLRDHGGREHAVCEIASAAAGGAL